MDGVEAACGSRAIKKDPLRDGATVDLVRRESFDPDHRSATARTWPDSRRCGRFDGGCRDCLRRAGRKHTPTQWKVVSAPSMREKPKEADADETLRQHVQAESTEKFDGTDRHRPRLTAVPVVLPTETDGI